MSDPVTPNEYQLALDLLRRDEPDAHHLTCPEIKVERTAELKVEPAAEGPSWATASWVITCPHGAVSDVSLMAELGRKNPDEDAP
jgi:hypothetical protein